MNLNLPSDINDFVKGLVSQGRFDSEAAAVTEGIRLLMTREKLRTEIQKGVKQLDDGQWFDEDTVFAEIEAEIDRNLAVGLTMLKNLNVENRSIDDTLTARVTACGPGS